MQVIKAVAITLGILAILALLAIYGGSRWLVSHQDEIAEKVVKTIGISDQVKRQCQQLETRYQREWDDAVNNDTIDRREDDFASMRQEIDQLCKPK